MESAGAVFLPVTGTLTVKNGDPYWVVYQKSAGYYWSSTSAEHYVNDDPDYDADGSPHWYLSHEMEFTSQVVDLSRNSRRHYGSAVRLVRELGEPKNCNKILSTFVNAEEEW